MFFKAIIFDLDDTLYDYNVCHTNAINKVFTKLCNIYNYKYIDIVNIYECVKKDLKIECGNVASSHNRFIYFKKMFENLNIEYDKIIEYNELYWCEYLECMRINDGVTDLLSFIKNICPNIKLCIITDFTAKEQFQKLNKLNITKYFDLIITSEEIGAEKPSCKIFNYILNKLNLLSNEVIMIGDNYEKDIIGAINNNIYPFHYNVKLGVDILYNDKYISFNNFNYLLSFLRNIYINLDNFEKISKYCGERYDLTQAGGGNISFKYDNLLFVKASGISLSNISKNSGYSILYNHNNIFIKNRPSIEKYLHYSLKKWIVHLHPIQINKILVRDDAITIIKQLIDNSIIIKYVTPGKDIYDELKLYWTDEKIIFLLNHGVIFTSDDYDELYNLIENTLNIFEKYLNLDYSIYKYTNNISRLLNNGITYISMNNIIIKNLLYNTNIFNNINTNPDSIVYCGKAPLYLNNINSNNEFDDYIKLYNEKPRIIIYNKNLYINSSTLYKCYDIEQVLSSNLEIIDNNRNINYLNENEIDKISNWDAEKYRRNL
jgi:HAD superfamily hydrolase (TIGR01549 family)